jgi:hypothetical protein
MTLRPALLATLGLWTLACGQATAPLEPAGGKKQPEAWSYSDNPALFSSTLEFSLEALPSSGEAEHIPWAGSYWAYTDDSINHRWNGESTDAPSTKYGKAFGVTGVEDAVSKFRGVDAAASRKECSATTDCDSKLGESCSKRAGQDKGRCIPGWWGICHAWAPASILVSEPKMPVTRNGVTFKVQDLKALVTLAHDQVNLKFASLRCDADADQGAVTFDEHGRPMSACRDTNPGTYHVLLANYLGKQRQAFVEDRTYDDEVWNQPLRGYRVLEKRVVTVDEANTLVGVQFVGGTTTKRSGTVAKDAWVHEPAIPVTPGQNVVLRMTGTGDADVYVRFGAQPSETAYTCRPYLQGSSEECLLSAPSDATSLYVSVLGYSEENSYSWALTIGGSKPTGYVLNAKAASLVFVRTEVQYITEASSETDGHLGGSIDRYTKKDLYEYVLELDVAGKIIGGEWAGDSKLAHPDFVTLPLNLAQTSVASGKITWANVKSLLDESTGNTPPPTGGSQKTVDQEGVVARGELRLFGPFDAAAGEFKVALSGTGDADLYVRKGSAPTDSAWDCRPYFSGSMEECAVAGPGTFYVGVRGYADSSTFTAHITFTAGAVPPPPPPTTGVAHLDLSGTVALGEMKVFTVSLPAGTALSIQAASAQNIDLYLDWNRAPTTTMFAKRTYGTVLTASTPQPAVLQIGVYGRLASSFTLKTVPQ